MECMTPGMFLLLHLLFLVSSTYAQNWTWLKKVDNNLSGPIRVFAGHTDGAFVLYQKIGSSSLQTCDNCYELKFYNGGGALQWTKSIAGQPFDVFQDSQNNVWLTGSFAGSRNFLGTTLTSNGGTDIFLLKLNSAGSKIFTVNYGSTSDDSGIEVTEINNSNLPFRRL